jgi:hypothetical protein
MITGAGKIRIRESDPPIRAALRALLGDRESGLGDYIDREQKPTRP